MSSSPNTLGQRVASRRAALGLTQRALAARCGFTETTLSMIEGDKQPNPSLRTLRALSKHLEVSIDDLAGSTQRRRRVTK